MPVSRADLTVLIGVLETLEDTDGLIDGTTNAVIVDVDVAELALGIDQEDTTEGLSVVKTGRISIVDAVSLHDLASDIGEEEELDVVVEATLGGGSLEPAEVSVRRITRDTNDSGVEGLELLESVGVGDELSGADEGVVHGVEEEEDPTTLEILEGGLVDNFLTLGTSKSEGGSGLTDAERHCRVS